MKKILGIIAVVLFVVSPLLLEAQTSRRRPSSASSSAPTSQRVMKVMASN